MGRPKKPDAVKPGQLKDGLMRFSFIADRQQIMSLKEIARVKELSMKDLMHKIISGYISGVERGFPPSKKNLQKLKQYFLKN